MDAKEVILKLYIKAALICYICGKKSKIVFVKPEPLPVVHYFCDKCQKEMMAGFEAQMRPPRLRIEGGK